MQRGAEQVGGSGAVYYYPHLCERAPERGDGGFRGTVVRRGGARAAIVPGNATHVDDPTEAAVLHAWNDGLAHHRGADKIHVEIVHHQLLCHHLIAQLPTQVQATRIVHQDINPTTILSVKRLRLGDEVGDAFGLEHVRTHAGRAAAEALDHLHRLLRCSVTAVVVHHHIRPGASELDGTRAADVPRPASDQRVSTCEVEHRIRAAAAEAARPESLTRAAGAEDGGCAPTGYGGSCKAHHSAFTRSDRTMAASEALPQQLTAPRGSRPRAVLYNGGARAATRGEFFAILENTGLMINIESMIIHIIDIDV